jgi:hypothetical protein
MPWHLAQVNVAHMRATPSDSVRVGLVSRIADLNQLAEESAGFVWRLSETAATPNALQVFEPDVRPCDLNRFFYSLSVWECMDDLRAYVYRSAHAAMLGDRQRWMRDLAPASLALWYIPVGHRPTMAESVARLRYFHAHGPTEWACTFRRFFQTPTS